LEFWTQREVREGVDIIVGEVNGFMVFGGDAQVLDRGDFVAFTKNNVSMSSL
jgi:hypothetical protein